MHSDDEVERLKRSLQAAEQEMISIESAAQDVSSLLDQWLPTSMSHTIRWKVIEESRQATVKMARLAETAKETVPNAKAVPLSENALKMIGDLEITLPKAHEVPLAEGWLMADRSRRWVSVLRDRLRWPDSKNAKTNGVIPLETLTNVSIHDDSIVLEISGQPSCIARQSKCFTAENCKEASRWFRTISMQSQRCKDEKGVGYLSAYDRCSPGQEVIMKLPVLDNDPSTRERLISWHVKPGQFVEKDDPVCDVDLRYKDRRLAQRQGYATAATLFAACQGTVSKLYSDRVDRISGNAMVDQGSPLICISRDAKWERGFAYLPSLPQSAPAASAGDSEVARNSAVPARQSPAAHGRRCRRSDSGPGLFLSGAARLPSVVSQTVAPPPPPPRNSEEGRSEAAHISFAVATMSARYSPSALAAARAILAAAGGAELCLP